MGMEPYRLSAVEAIKAIKNKQLTALEWMKSCVDRISSVDGNLHAWVYFDRELAIEKARIIDAKRHQSEDVSPLFGTPIGVKDIIDTKDMPTCMGSPIWKDFTPGHNARVVDRLVWNGGIIAGKTVTAEFGVHYPGPTVNPHNSKYTPGTSSSGSAAAVAAYMVPMALGTQTLGSLIRPASYCGVYAFKPTFGLIPRVGILKTTDSLDQVGYICRTVEDMRLFFDVLATVGPNHPFTEKIKASDSKKLPYRIALVSTAASEYEKDYAKEAILKFAREIEKLNEVIIAEARLPSDFDVAWDVHKVIYEKCLSYYFKEEFASQPDRISNIMKKMIMDGQKISQEEYVKNLTIQNELSQKLESFFEKYDIILTLSASGEAPEGLHTMNDKDSILIWTMCGVPMMNVPQFVGPNGLPFGLQLVARRYGDMLLLKFAQLLKDRQIIPDAPNPAIKY
jgi:Asp-tRNA(Asn)/Glu-tRNA(Gln) amidotransferase A subunit family amidase